MEVSFGKQDLRKSSRIKKNEDKKIQDFKDLSRPLQEKIPLESRVSQGTGGISRNMTVMDLLKKSELKKGNFYFLNFFTSIPLSESL